MKALKSRLVQALLVIRDGRVNYFLTDLWKLKTKTCNNFKDAQKRPSIIAACRMKTGLWQRHDLE
ncbi:MAG: hypothetical protein WA635_02645 [Gallionella sp.]